MNKKNTKRALLTSVLSLTLCGSMLVGTTFAWFTDSVSSTNNVIMAGNLDVELYYKTKLADDWTLLDNGQPLFTEATLWEPGHTEVVYLKVANVGSLSLKYRLGIDLVSEKAGENAEGEFKLSEYLYTGLAWRGTDENDERTWDTYETRKDYEVRATTKFSDVTLDMTSIEALGYKFEPTLQSKEEDEVALVVTMPETVGNEANYVNDKAPRITFGANLVAAQATVESDSFDNYYDNNATYEEIGGNNVKTAADFVNALTNLKSGETVKLMNDIELADVDIVLQDWTVTGTTEENGATINVVEYANKVYNVDLNGYELSATDHAIDLHGGTLNIKNGTISVDIVDQAGAFISVGGHSPVYNAHKAMKCGQNEYNPTSVLNLENVVFEGTMATNTTGITSGQIIDVNCHAQVHIKNCSFKIMMDNGVYANHIDVYNNAAAMIEKATAVYIYEGTKFYGDPTFQAFKNADNSDWKVKGGHLVYIVDGYKLEAAPIADGDTYAWYTVVAE